MLDEMTDRYFEALKKIDQTKVEEMSVMMSGVYGTHNRIFICGNGGSASMSSHFANDLSKYTLPKKPFSVISLTDNISIISAIANDLSYKEVFLQQLKVHGIRNGDIVVAISSKGNSENIIEAVKYAKSQNATTIGLTGSTGGMLKNMADYSIVVESDDYTIIEPVHSFILHEIAERLKKEFSQA